MNNSRHAETPFGISLGDIYFVIFRHKWKILLLGLVGLVAGGIYYFTKQPPFQSEAELFIRYVVDVRNFTPTDTGSRVSSVIDPGLSIMKSETKILTSFDLFTQVATNVGPEKILAKYGGGNDALRAASVIQGNLKVEPQLDSGVINIIFRSLDPDVVQPVLREIIRDYLESHARVHSATGLTDDVLSDRITQLRLQISQTDDELRMAKTNAGIVDVAEARKAYSDEIARIRRELYQAETEMAGHESDFAGKPAPTNASVPANIPPEIVTRYKSAVSRLSYLQKKEDDYLLVQGYTDENKLVKENRANMAEPTRTKSELEAKYPSLAEMVFPLTDPASTPSATPGSSTGTLNSAQLATLPMRIKKLQQQLARTLGDAGTLDETAVKISDLERKKQVQEKSYKFFADTLDESRINAGFGTDNDSSIKELQHPSPPFKDFGKFYKNIAAMILGCLLAGLAWAFAIEYYFDRSVKRPVEIETKLHLPFFLSIPDLGAKDRKRLAAPDRLKLTNGAEKTGSPLDNAIAATANLETNSWQVNHALDSHYDALRDRLVLYFESINLTRKPKLVAVTSTDRGAGVSTIAAGLAASLSETGDGRVLLVDMNRENGAAQQFFNGKPNCKLDDALISEKRDTALVQERLYFVSEGSNASDKLTRVLPKRFATLVPQLKASDYDYIIFDMPPVSQTSVTTRLAGFMDTVMLVIESEKTDREVVQQASALLAQSKANVTAVLNKTKKYIPSRLQHDINAEI